MAPYPFPPSGSCVACVEIHGVSVVGEMKLSPGSWGGQPVPSHVEVSLARAVEVKINGESYRSGLLLLPLDAVRWVLNIDQSRPILSVPPTSIDTEGA